MKILNWNTEWLSPRSQHGRFDKATALIASHDPDVICLTEARPELMPSGGETITSEVSGAGNIENRGGRKVALWSRFGWSNVDTIGSDKLPEGRYVSAKTECMGIEFHFVGMCIPYQGYRNHRRWGEGRKRNSQGACEYLDALRQDVLTRQQFSSRAILLGDFNLQIPPYNYPYRRSEVNQKRKETFDSWLIPTAGISRHFIDHIAMSTDLRVNSLQYISRFTSDDTQLSDHSGVCIEIIPKTD